MMMGAFGYIIGRSAGRPVLLRMLKDEGRLADIETAFGRNDVLTLAVCQALPILPELSAVLAGIARMAPLRFALAWVLGSIPYAFILAYAGSVSSAYNLRPAILAAIGITALLVLIWTRLLRPSAR
jgi:membrane protein DedA with SNARE-associated domain